VRTTGPSVRALAWAGILGACAVTLSAGPSPDALPLHRGPRACEQGGNALPRSTLPMVLVGVMVDSAEPSRSACLIRCTQPIDRLHASTLHAREIACDLAEIEEIRPDAVIVRNLLTDRLEFIPLQDSGPKPGERMESTPPLPSPAVVKTTPEFVSVDVPKASVEHYLVNLSELLSAAQATPRFRDAANGQRVIEGFELRQIRTGSVVEKVGLQDGDVILDVNGEALDGLPAVLRLLGQARTMGQATLSVLRGNQRMTFVLNTK
jgi:type II secretory pathway component PulC